MRFVIASGNEHKLIELKRIWGAEGLELDAVSLAAFPGYVEPVEDGSSFAENALIKAHAANDSTGLPAIADDSGIEVDVLNNMPGIRSARWAGVGATPEESLDLLIRQLLDVPYERRTARFVCAMALVDGDAEHVVEGVMNGHLLLEKHGEHGFGYDPVFVTDGQQVTNGELTDAQKDALSHRGKAARALIPFIRSVSVPGI
ncbi:MAG: non-canonical purine NTP pyrophosphatase [Propionibacteriaceae bacterium]|jgi:XTP/dITP diphosphohydrolase|nr:non-canonical purine NTP pyrophosphatase [Propionibacteriaceae bacterium]